MMESSKGPSGCFWHFVHYPWDPYSLWLQKLTSGVCKTCSTNQRKSLTREERSWDPSEKDTKITRKKQREICKSLLDIRWTYLFEKCSQNFKAVSDSFWFEAKWATPCIFYHHQKFCELWLSEIQIPFYVQEILLALTIVIHHIINHRSKRWWVGDKERWTYKHLKEAEQRIQQDSSITLYRAWWPKFQTLQLHPRTSSSVFVESLFSVVSWMK